MSGLRLFPCLILLLCVACAAPPSRPSRAVIEAGWESHRASLEPIRQWELRGRLAVRIDERGGQATLYWLHEESRTTIRLNGPFGSGAVRIVQDGAGARLRDSENREFQAASAEELLIIYTGWQLPVAHLDWWARGLPVPDLGVQRELDDTGRLRVLRQQGWEVQYQQYVRVDGYDLPQRMTLVRSAGAAVPAIEARLVIDRWLQVK